MITLWCSPCWDSGCSHDRPGVAELELRHDLEALGDAVGHALGLGLADDGRLHVVEAGLHAAGGGLHLVLRPLIAHRQDLQLVIRRQPVRLRDKRRVVPVLLLQEISHEVVR